MTLIAADEMMILSGLALPLTTGLEYQALVVLSCACFAFIMYHSLRALVDVMLGRAVGRSCCTHTARGPGPKPGASLYTRERPSPTGARAKAWCLLIHAEASLSPETTRVIPLNSLTVLKLSRKWYLGLALISEGAGLVTDSSAQVVPGWAL